jgi:hypothetical protein
MVSPFVVYADFIEQGVWAHYSMATLDNPSGGLALGMNRRNGTGCTALIDPNGAIVDEPPFDADFPVSEGSRSAM